jgi:hypothetical protein
MACRGLGQVKPLGCTSNMALGQQSLKYDQQVEVGTSEINFVHRVNKYYELD